MPEPATLDALGPLTEVSPQQRNAAIRAVCAYALDVADARDMLAALDLNPAV